MGRRVGNANHDDIRMTSQNVRRPATHREHIDVNVGLVHERVQNDVREQPWKVDERHTSGHAF